MEIGPELQLNITVLEITYIEWIDASYKYDDGRFIPKRMTVKANIGDTIVENIAMKYIPLSNMPAIKEEIVKNLAL